MKPILDFILRMDARAARAIGVSIALFAVVGVVFLLGRFVLDVEPGAASAWFADMAGRWYALPVTILIFTLLSFLGAPQFGLMAAAIVAVESGEEAINHRTLSMAVYTGPSERRRQFERELM